MALSEVAERVENNKVSVTLSRALNSIYYPLVTAAFSLICYYLGWDVVMAWYLCLSGLAITLTCKDVTPVFVILLFVNVISSMQHCPSLGVNSDYYSKPEILSQLITAGVLFFCGVIYRTVTGIARGNFKLSPMFVGICVLAAAFVINGIFYSQYTPKNLMYGAVLAIVVLGIFVFGCGNVEAGGDSLKRIAFYFLIFFAVLAVEVAVAYATYEGLIVDGKVVRGLLKFGWGTYNNMGMLVVLCIPSSFYLAGILKHGWIFSICGILNVALAFFTMSRQAVLAGAILAVACVIWLIIKTKGKARYINIAIFGALVVMGVIFLGVFHEKFLGFFDSLSSNFWTGSGRTELWRIGIKNFLNHPLFGVGFYDPAAKFGEPGYYSGELSYSIPRMYHNTIIQFMASCGLVGLAAYGVHRVQTVISFFKNVTNDRVFIVVTICALLIVNLLDNHLFYIMPTLVYTMLVVYLFKTEKKEQPSLSAGW